MKSEGPLIVRLCNWVGEATLALPALMLLERQGYSLHLVGKRWAVDLFEGHGWPVHVRPPKRGDAIAQLRRMKADLAAQNGGFVSRPNALLLTNSFSSAVEYRLAGLKPVGFAVEGRRFFLAKAVHYREAPHVADEYWALAQALAPSAAARPSDLGLMPSHDQVALAQQRLAAQGIEPGHFVLICPFSGEGDPKEEKVWPHFPQLVEALLENGRRVVICPGPGEEHKAHVQFNRATILESVRLGTYAAIGGLAEVTVANDSGPAHLVAGVGGRLVSVLGPDGVQRWYPVGADITIHGSCQGWPPLDNVLRAVLAQAAYC